jgi:biopolymer transport protein ExbD
MSGGGGGNTPEGYASDELDLTPMIDATFMLLSFFIVSSSMDAGSLLKLPEAHNGRSKGLKSAIVLTVFADPQQPTVYLSDGQKDNGPASMAEVTSYVREGVAQQRTTVVIKADRECPSGFVNEVARAAGEAEGVKDFYVGVRDSGL